MRFQEKIGTLTKTSNTQVQLTGETLVKLGGQFKSLINSTLLTSTTGVGGLDTGAVAASTFYYVYAVSNGNVEGIVASTSSQSPTGFPRYKKVGAFYTDGSSNIFKAYVLGEVNILSGSCTVTAANVFTTRVPASWFASNSGTTSKVTTFGAGIFSVTPTGVACSGNGGQITYVSAISTTSATTPSYNGSSGAGADVEIRLSVWKTGIDAVQPDWKDY